MLALSTIDHRGLVPNLSLGVHSTRVLDNLLRSWKCDLSEADACKSGEAPHSMSVGVAALVQE